MYFKNRLQSLLKKILIAILTLSTISCASTTHIRVVNPQGNPEDNVKVYLNEEYKGKGDVTHTDKKSAVFLAKCKIEKRRM